VNGGRNVIVYIYLCSGTTPSPTIAINYTAVETWHHERHGVFECVESHINITSPTVFSIATSADIDEATVQCLGACQSSNICEYWTLDLTKQLCHLKKTNDSKVATNDSVISGERLCASDFRDFYDFWCDQHGCDLEINITSHCGEEFKLEILEGDFK
jgi:hypothetical protein